ncbi:hypothetical protein [Spirillospora albida]|uniref:hypothetical protein n=1 Tax=Spirillospora albida TaxID=58123 RepID=UPI0012F7293F|nr:hypothetical protein [Spirillospora albida]
MAALRTFFHRAPARVPARDVAAVTVPDHPPVPARRPAAAGRAAGVPPWAAPVWAAGYGALQVAWRAGHRPAGELSPIGTDLVVFTGWGAPALCGAAALVLAVLGVPAAARLGRGARRVLQAAGWAVTAALAAASAMLLLDIVGVLLPGLGMDVYPAGALSRAGCAAAAVLAGLSTRRYARLTRTGPAVRRVLDETPGWAFAAAYAAVGGCGARIAAQAAVGFGETPLSGGVSLVLFEAGFVLAGVVLPLALVHRFGRVWPRWVPGLAGRGVPRRPVLWPAAGLSTGLVVYFGMVLAQMVWERLHGRDPFPPEGGLDLPEAFFWVAVPGYLLWGAGMAVAARAYALRTASRD